MVKKDAMIELYPSSKSKETASDAEDIIQLEAVAYQINNAANTGELMTVFQEELRPNVLASLKSAGYEIQLMDNAASSRGPHVIKWK